MFSERGHPARSFAKDGLEARAPKNITLQDLLKDTLDNAPPVTAPSPQVCTAAFTAALVRRDMAAALALLTNDVVFFYSNGSAIGKDVFAALMTANWKVVSDYEYSTLDSIWVTQSDSAACVIYGFAWLGMAGGAKVGGSGRGTRVLSNDGAGWRIAHEHLSAGQWAT
jgi:ketosteroid isomerase-like protein